METGTDMPRPGAGTYQLITQKGKFKRESTVKLRVSGDVSCGL